MLTVHVFHLVSLLFIAIINPYTPLFEIRIFKLFLYVYFLWFSYSYSWVVLAIWEEGISVGVLYLCFAIYHAWGELFVVQYQSLVSKFTCTSKIMVIVEENVYSHHTSSYVHIFLQNVRKKWHYQCMFVTWFYSTLRWCWSNKVKPYNYIVHTNDTITKTHV